MTSSNDSYREFGLAPSYTAPLPIVMETISYPPLFYLTLSETWIPYVNGAIKALLAEEIWEETDDSLRQDAIQGVEQILDGWVSAQTLMPPVNYFKDFYEDPNSPAQGFEPERYDSAAMTWHRTFSWSLPLNIGEASCYVTGYSPVYDSLDWVPCLYLRISTINTRPDTEAYLTVHWSKSEDGGIEHSTTVNGDVNLATLSMGVGEHLGWFTVVSNRPVYIYIVSA